MAGRTPDVPKRTAGKNKKKQTVTLAVLAKRIQKLAKEHPGKRVSYIDGFEDWGGPKGLSKQLRFTLVGNDGKFDLVYVPVEDM